MALEAAASGQGIVLSRRSLALPWIKRGELVCAFPAYAQSVRGFCIQVANPNRAATAFAAWIQGVCEQLEKESLKK
jgi:LysR family transcriptional regulator, glycine cleavage system transcriptional activator